MHLRIRIPPPKHPRPAPPPHRTTLHTILPPHEPQPPTALPTLPTRPSTRKMSSWTRPTKSQPIPPPYYITHPSTTTYCHTCGRLMPARKPRQQPNLTPPKYCSARCRNSKPAALDARIEDVFLAFLRGEQPVGQGAIGALASGGVGSLASSSASSSASVRGKGRARNVVLCRVVEEVVFGVRDAEKRFGRRRNRRARGVVGGEWCSVDMVEEGGEGANEGEGGEGGEGGEEGEGVFVARREEGQRIAVEREMVRRAARRLCVFGVPGREGDGPPAESVGMRDGDRLCEAVMGGLVVEPSFAKGDWGIRWRE